MRTLVFVAFTLAATAAHSSAQVVALPSVPAALTTAAADDLQETQVAAAASGQVTPSVGSLFRDLGRDLRRLPSREAFLVLGLAGATSLAVRPRDGVLSRHVSESVGFDYAFEGGEGVGGGVAQGGVALGTYVLGRALHKPALSLLGADLIRAQIINTALTQSIKFAVNRERPDGGAFSFPSGHTSSTFATATVLQRHLGWKVGVPAYAVAAAVGGSRVQERRHYLSDIVFGAAIGVVSGRAVTVGHGKAVFAVSPIATVHGAGVSFAWVGPR